MAKTENRPLTKKDIVIVKEFEDTSEIKASDLNIQFYFEDGHDTWIVLPNNDEFIEVERLRLALQGLLKIIDKFIKEREHNITDSFSEGYYAAMIEAEGIITRYLGAILEERKE